MDLSRNVVMPLTRQNCTSIVCCPADKDGVKIFKYIGMSMFGEVEARHSVLKYVLSTTILNQIPEFERDTVVAYSASILD